MTNRTGTRNHESLSDAEYAKHQPLELSPASQDIIATIRRQNAAIARKEKLLDRRLTLAERQAMITHVQNAVAAEQARLAHPLTETEAAALGADRAELREAREAWVLERFHITTVRESNNRGAASGARKMNMRPYADLLDETAVAYHFAAVALAWQVTGLE